MTQMAGACQKHRLQPRRTGHWRPPLRFLPHWNRPAWMSVACLCVYNHPHPGQRSIRLCGWGFWMPCFINISNISSWSAATNRNNNQQLNPKRTFPGFHQPKCWGLFNRRDQNDPTWVALLWLTAPRFPQRLHQGTWKPHTAPQQGWGQSPAPLCERPEELMGLHVPRSYSSWVQKKPPPSDTYTLHQTAMSSKCDLVMMCLALVWAKLVMWLSGSRWQFICGLVGPPLWCRLKYLITRPGWVVVKIVPLVFFPGCNDFVDPSSSTIMWKIHLVQNKQNIINFSCSWWLAC